VILLNDPILQLKIDFQQMKDLSIVVIVQILLHSATFIIQKHVVLHVHAMHFVISSGWCQRPESSGLLHSAVGTW